MSGVEFAAGVRILTRSSPFPPEWGAPPLNVEERGRWVRFHALRAESRQRAAGVHVARRRLLEDKR